MKIWLCIAAAAVGYFFGGFNPAIAISKAVYHTDIRTVGSGNPGFTNFKRSFGNKWAWWVLVLDLGKAAVAVWFFGFLFGRYANDYALGAAYTGVFAVLGHAYPIFYRFKGGKGFLVSLSTVWVIDFRVGIVATALMVILLLLTHYMSLSTVLAMWSTPLLLWLCGASLTVILLVLGMVAFMTVRHRENFVRLFQGTERKFYLKKKE